MKRCLALVALSMLLASVPCAQASARKTKQVVTVYLKKGEAKEATLRKELTKPEDHVDVYLKETNERMRYKSESIDSIVLTEKGKRIVWQSKWINQSYNPSAPVNTARPLLVKRIWKGDRTSAYTCQVTDAQRNAYGQYTNQQVEQFYYGLNNEQDIRLYYSESIGVGTINLGNLGVRGLSLSGTLKLETMAKFFPQYPVFQNHLQNLKIKRSVFNDDKAIVIKYLDEYLRVK